MADEDRSIHILRDAPIIAGEVSPKGSITDVNGLPINDNVIIDSYLNDNTAVLTGLTGLSRRGDRHYRDKWARSQWQTVESSGMPDRFNLPSIQSDHAFVVDDNAPQIYVVDDNDQSIYIVEPV